MKPKTPTLASLATTFILALTPLAHAQQTAITKPLGFVMVNIAAGTGSTKTGSLVSMPLQDVAAIAGQSTGRITGITANTITNSDAGWTAGQLSTPASPYLIQITSGSANGRMFLISPAQANTATTVTISPEDAETSSLTSLGIVTGPTTGDTYKIIPCDTLGSLLGTPASSGVQGGTTPSAADTVILTTNGAARTYYFHTTLNRWTQVALGNPDATNVPVRPYFGFRYERLANTPLAFLASGSVPIVARAVPVRNAGSTVLSQYWPADSTLATLGLHSLSNWTSNATAQSADQVLITSNGTTQRFYHTGTEWKNAGTDAPANAIPIPAGASVHILQKGSDAGFTTLSQSVPYIGNL